MPKSVPAMAINQLSIELWECRMSGRERLMIFIRENRADKLKARFMVKGK